MMAMGEFAQVTEYLEASLTKGAEWVGDHDLYANLVDAAVRQRDETGIRRYAPLAEKAATRYRHRLYMAIADRAWGIVHGIDGKYNRARSRLERALETFTSLGAYWQVGRTYFELFRLIKGMGDLESAKNHLMNAESAFEKAGAALDITHMNELLENPYVDSK